MSDQRAALGLGHVVTADGKEWTLSDLTPAIRGAFQAWLEAGVLETIVGMKGELSPDDFRADLAEHSRSKFLQKYTWGNEYAREALTSQHGYAKLFQLLLSKNHQEVRSWTLEKVEMLFNKNPDAFKETVKYIVEHPKDQEPVAQPATP